MSIQYVSSYSFYPAYGQVQTPMVQPYIPVAPQPVPPYTPQPENSAFTPIIKPFDMNDYIKEELSQFPYTPEEQEVLKKDPTHDFTKDFVEKKDYSRALDYINRFDPDRNYAELKKYAANPAFDSLANSKFYNDSIFGFENLAKTIYSLHTKQQEAYKEVSTPGYMCPFIPDITRMIAGIDVNQCVTNLDKFFKSGFSDDLKYFIKNGTDKLSDLWYVSHNLEGIDKATDVGILTAPFSIM